MTLITTTGTERQLLADKEAPVPTSTVSRLGAFRARHHGAPALTLAAAILGFFMVTLDAVVVNVALPSIRHDLGGGIDGLQWVVDGYTLMFAALLLSSGALSDRFGARRAFSLGLAVFVVASVACGAAPSLSALVVARFVQGSAAAVLMPSSMALVRQAYTEPSRRTRAVAIWAMGGAVASSSGPVLGGLLTIVNWRLIFFINVPVGFIALVLNSRTARSLQRQARFDWAGQLTAVLGMGALTYGAIEAGAVGLGSPRVAVAFVVAVISLAAFVLIQSRIAHPMMPLELARRRNVAVPSVVGFAFMAGYFGLPFVMSLYLQDQRGFSPLQTGVVFLPMMLIGAMLTPFSARIGERTGAKNLITAGLVSMAVGLAVLGFVTTSAPTIWISALMILVGLAGPFAMPPATAVLLNSVPADRAGTASGIFNTSRQVGGALAVAVFGALLAQPAGFVAGVRSSLLIASAVAVVAAIVSRFVQPGIHHDDTVIESPDLFSTNLAALTRLSTDT